MNKTALWLLAAALPAAVIAQSTTQTAPPTDTLNNSTANESTTSSNDVATNTTDPTTNTTAPDQPPTDPKPKKNKKPISATE